jgi:hypothetical protein
VILKPGSIQIACARADSPVDCSELVNLTVPTTVPITTAQTTSASHPKVAVLRCAALQRPARAAMFIECFLSLARNTQ